MYVFMYCSYDKEAPTSVGAKQTPSFVLILCATFVTGSTKAASLVVAKTNKLVPYRLDTPVATRTPWRGN